MGYYEDDLMYIYQIVEKEGLRPLFDKQLEKMAYQDKHRYKTSKERWDYALYRIKGGESIKNQNVEPR